MQKYHKFVVQIAVYFEDGNVPKKQCIAKVMPFLSGKAHEFYIREVVLNPKEWELSQFFQELFDYCFPVDFLNKQRKHWDRCHQGSRTVCKFLYELNKISGLVGDFDERQKVCKFWFGLCNELQRKLWLDWLNPEYSAFAQVRESAEASEQVLDAALNIERHDQGQNRGKGLSGQQVPKKHNWKHQPKFHWDHG